METNKMRKELHRLAESYTPEWIFSEENPDSGSVLGMLIADMLEDSRKRLKEAIHKHKLRYLNQFDPMLKEPVSAARGYVQFKPVAGSPGVMAVPKGTQLSAQGAEHEIIFETMHDICLADSSLVSVMVTDGREDKISVMEKTEGFYAFDCDGANQAFHAFYLCYDTILEGLKEVKLTWKIKSASDNMARQIAALFASGKVEIAMLEPEEEGSGYRHIAFDRITAEGSLLRLNKENYSPVTTQIEGRTGYHIRIRTLKNIPEVDLAGILLGMEGEMISPDMVLLEGVDTTGDRFAPFGVPLQLLAECRTDSIEVFSKKDAMITLSFTLDYEWYEEKMELPQAEVDYKAIMKRPVEPAHTQAAKVYADRVVWEYLSINGWKRLLEDNDTEHLMNGQRRGEIRLQFICPGDMVAFEPGEPRLRFRLIQAANIYKIPAIYQCPVIRHLRFSYSYHEREKLPRACYSINNFQKKECLDRFVKGINTQIFYSTEKALRSMYLCFNSPIQGLPFCLYVDLVNDSKEPLDFTVEYGRENDFKPVRIVDGTNGFLNSGIIQILISGDMKEKELLGKKGYFLRFTSHERSHPKYRLPLIKGIYLNMAKVENKSTDVEYFFIDKKDEPLIIKLKNENLRQITLWVYEYLKGQRQWVEWKQAVRSHEPGRVYQVDMAEGIVTFDAFAFSSIQPVEEGPQIKIEHGSYSGSAANVEKNLITTLRDSNRFVSQVHNPFPAYGGSDAWTRESTTEYITGILRTRGRAVTKKDILDLLRQTCTGVRAVKCGMDVDSMGNPVPDRVTVAVLIREYEKGSQFYELRDEMKRKLEQNSSFVVMGKEIDIIQPFFLRLNVRVWLQKDTMENAYNLQKDTMRLLEEFMDPLTGGPDGKGWEIGSFPRVSQLKVYLRNKMKEAVVIRLTVTARIKEREVEIREDISGIIKSPFILPLSGEHVVHIDLKT